MNQNLQELLLARPDEVPIVPFDGEIGGQSWRVTAVLERTVVGHPRRDPFAKAVVRIVLVGVPDPSSLVWQPELGRRSTDSGVPDGGIRAAGARGRANQPGGDHRFRTERLCRRCRVTKPLAEFSNPREGWCRECDRQYRRRDRDIVCRWCKQPRVRAAFPGEDARRPCLICSPHWFAARRRLPRNAA